MSNYISIASIAALAYALYSLAASLQAQYGAAMQTVFDALPK